MHQLRAVDIIVLIAHSSHHEGKHQHYCRRLSTTICLMFGVFLLDDSVCVCVRARVFVCTLIRCGLLLAREMFARTIIQSVVVHIHKLLRF